MSLANLPPEFSGRRIPDQPPPPSEFEPVARRDMESPTIIPISRPDPLQSPRSRELQDLIHPDHGRYTGALGRFARSARFTIKEVWVAVARGGDHSIVVTSDRLPVTDPSSSWTSSADRRTFEYDETKFRFELEEEYAHHLIPAIVGGKAFNHYPLPFSIGPIAHVRCQYVPPNRRTRSGAAQYEQMNWGMTVAHNFPWQIVAPGHGVQHVNCPFKPVYVRKDGTQHPVVVNRALDLEIVASKPQWLEEGMDLGAFPFENPVIKIVPLNTKYYVEAYLHMHAAPLQHPANQWIRSQLSSIRQIGAPLAINIAHVNHGVPPMVCFKVGMKTSFTVGTLTELRVSEPDADSQNHVALIAPAPFAFPFSDKGDSGSMVFGIVGGQACPIGLLQGSFASGTANARTRVYSLPQALWHFK